jgi:hypothetical protein
MPNIFMHFREKEGCDLQNPSCHSFLGKDTNLCVTHLWKEGYDGLFLSNEKRLIISVILQIKSPISFG